MKFCSLFAVSAKLRSFYVLYLFFASFSIILVASNNITTVSDAQPFALTPYLQGHILTIKICPVNNIQELHRRKLTYQVRMKPLGEMHDQLFGGLNRKPSCTIEFIAPYFIKFCGRKPHMTFVQMVDRRLARFKSRCP